jgi:hypothetical protein
VSALVFTHAWVDAREKKTIGNNQTHELAHIQIITTVLLVVWWWWC